MSVHQTHVRMEVNVLMALLDMYASVLQDSQDPTVKLVSVLIQSRVLNYCFLVGHKCPKTDV